MNEKKNELEVKNLITKCFGVKKNIINLSTSSDDIEKWDSVGHIRLILLVEKKFKIKIDQSEYPNLLSLKSLVKYIEKKID